MGGTSAVSDAVVDAVKAIVHSGDLTPITVTRLAGETRYATAKLISEVPGLMDKDDRLILVNGTDGRWADALSASSLAAAMKWPIILTDGTGLSGSSAAAVDAYQALAGTSDLYLIVGGPAVMTTGVENALDALAVPMANIDRRGGADRWQTNFLMNRYQLAAALLGEGKAGGAFLGAKVASVSGLAPWDALVAGPWAATNAVHLLLSPPTAPTPYGTGLVGFLATVNAYPDSLWTIGGKNAVANSVRDALVAAAQSVDLAGPTLTGCEVGRTSVTAVFPGALSGAESGRVTNSTSNAYWSINAVKDSTTDSVVTAGSQLATKADGATLANTTYKMTTAALALGDVVKFHGFVEGVSSAARNVGSATCTVTADVTPPSATIKSVTDGSGKLDHFVVTLSETVKSASSTLSAIANWKIGGSSMFASGTDTLSATQLDAAGLVYKVSQAAGNTKVSMAALSVITFENTSLTDVAGNNATVDAASTAATDLVKATMTAATPVCNADSAANSAAQWTRGGLTITAKKAAVGGAWDGRAPNGYKLRVVSQRGLVIPSVSVDSAALLITVTLDANYHNAADVVTVAANVGANANLDWAGSSALTATTADLAPSRKGKDDCKMTIVYSEPASITSASLTIDGVVETITSGANTSAATAAVILFESTATGKATVSLTATTSDAQTTALTNSTTASTTLP